MARRPVSSGPPVLRLRLFSRLRTLLLVNIVPLLVCVYLGVQFARGAIEFQVEQAQAVAMAMALVGIACLAFVGWCLVPVLGWFRRYTRWHMRHDSALLWFIPTVGAWILFLVGWVLGLLVILAVLVLVAGSAWQAFSEPSAPPAAETPAP